MQSRLETTNAALELLELDGSAQAKTAKMTGDRLLFEDLQVFREQDLPSLQGQKRYHMTYLLQAIDGVINVELCGMGLVKSDAAFLI